MIDELKPYHTTRISAFLTAISGATESVKELTARSAILAANSGTAALQIVALSNAAQTMATSQALATRCQCNCETPTKPPSTESSPSEKTWKGFFVGAAAIGAAGLWSAAVKRLWTMVTAPIVMKSLAAIARIVRSLRAFELAAQAFVAVTDTIVELLSAVGAFAAGVPLTAVATAVALIGGTVHLIWRNWTAIVRTMQKLGSTISIEALTIMRHLAPAIGPGSTGDGLDRHEPSGNATSHQRWRGGLRAFASAAVNALAASVLVVAPPSLRTLEASQMSDGFDARRLSVRPVAAAAMLAVPLLVAPTMVGISPGRATAKESNVSMVFNSTPTIVINACQPDDIEHRVVEALRQHREAIYLEWSRELQRRQRTEF